MQNTMQITAKWSKWKPEVEFQYGERLFYKNGISYISAVNWDIWTKFGLMIDFDLPNTAAPTSRKPEVVLSCRVRHPEKSKWRNFPQ